MKSILSLVALCTVVGLCGCKNNKSVSPGAVGDKSSCSGSGSCCQDKTKSGTNMGAVGDKKSGCCSGDAKTCPVTGKSSETVSPGAVSDTQNTGGCCAGHKTGN